MSSAHMNRNVASDEKQKPVMILDFNPTKFGVDLADQIIGTYSTKRKSNQWPVALFSYMLDTSALNGYTLYSSVFPKWNGNLLQKSRLYLKYLAYELVKPQLLHRKSSPHGDNALRLLSKYKQKKKHQHRQQFQPLQKLQKKDEESAMCTLYSNRKWYTTYSNFCQKCGETFNPKHSTTLICVNCAPLESDEKQTQFLKFFDSFPTFLKFEHDKS